MVNLKNNIPSSASSPVTLSNETNARIPSVVGLLSSPAPCFLESRTANSKAKSARQRKSLLTCVRERPGIDSRAVSVCFVNVGGETPGALPPRSAHPVVVKVPPVTEQSKPGCHAGHQDFSLLVARLQESGPELEIPWEYNVYAPVL